MPRAHRVMTFLTAASLLLGLASGCGGDEPGGREIDWDRAAPLSGRVEGGRLAVEVIPTPGLSVPLVVIEEPGIGGRGYVLAGDISYTDIPQPGYLEMWSVFANGDRYFTRTLGPTGPMAVLVGDSTARRFELPFYLNGAPPPARLEVNLVLPAGGSVSVGPLVLRPLDSSGSDAWWTDSSGGWIGGLAGSALGVIGALTGVLAGLRRGRRFVVAAIPLVMVFGVAAFATGVLAAALGQPRAVFYPLMLTGAIAVAVFGLIRVPVKRAYQDDELRKMRALDV